MANIAILGMAVTNCALLSYVSRKHGLIRARGGSEVSTSWGEESQSLTDQHSSVQSTSSLEDGGFMLSSVETSSEGYLGGSDFSTDVSDGQRLRR